jgi:tetratricopeptide (TPR) repeat protein
MAYNSLGKALHKQGRYEEAIGNYRQALLKSPDMAEAQWNLERARQQRGK